jgi:hypothetical protein
MVTPTSFGITLPTSEMFASAFGEMLNWEYVDRILDVRFVSIYVVRTHSVNRQNTLIHNILSTALQLSISQKPLGKLPWCSKVLPIHVGATILTYIYIYIKRCLPVYKPTFIHTYTYIHTYYIYMYINTHT